MELLSKPGLSAPNIKIIQELIDNCISIGFNHEIKSEGISFRRSHKLKLPDAIILATAKYLRKPLITLDNDFKKVKDVEILYLSL
jgi:predicted nucleic acid-binding protein